MKHLLLLLPALILAAANARAADDPVVHVYASPSRGIFANAYIVETAHSLVVVDATLTVSDAKALRSRVDAIGKPLRAVLITHGHPDHYNGLTDLLAGTSGVPVIATAAVAHVIRQYDAAKEAQWKPVFKEEWPARRTFPTRVMRDGESLDVDGVRFVVRDLGPGESHADSYWLVRGAHPVAFIGDVVIHGLHAYMTDGHSSAWLRNLTRVRRELRRAGVHTVYPGHGASGDLSMLDWQRAYLERYRATVADLARGRARLTDEEKTQLSEAMRRFLPTEDLAFLIPLGADSVAAELARAH
jgi:glyoxylase-like metal-dependent hydrolase (beta-lactamase superfamily II)